ncbi:MAG: hypothetical protein U0228_36255 [Myxococcaceae bacterium]
MKNHSFQVSEGTLRIDCTGTLDAATVRSICDDVKAMPGREGVRRAIVVTTAVADIVEAGKKELVNLQRELCATCRTAWVDERARFRGVALWVMHLAGDLNGKAVATMQQAEAWLSSSESREDRANRAVGR